MKYAPHGKEERRVLVVTIKVVWHFARIVNQVLVEVSVIGLGPSNDSVDYRVGEIIVDFKGDHVCNCPQR